MSEWNPRALPSQAGKSFVVTGGNAGIGYFISEQLAAAGARVVMAARNATKADAAIHEITRRYPSAQASSVQLDLGSYASIRTAAADLARLDRIDVLIENAGAIMPSKTRETTSDGNEMMFGTNHLGHFLLTALLLPTLEKTPGSRVVTMGSLATRQIRPDLTDLQSEREFSAFAAYARSKHATESFGFELDRRMRAAGSTVASLVAHPGFALDGRTPLRAGISEPSRAERLAALPLLPAGGKHSGAWPAVRAATDPDATGGQYWAPRFLARGRPVLAKPVKLSASEEFGRALWAESETLVGQKFEV